MTVITKLSLVQLIFTLILSVICFYALSGLHAISALLGGLICSLGNLFFAGKLFLGKKMAKQTKQMTEQEVEANEILRQFYRSEALKIAFTLAMFILVFKLLNLEFLVFILAYSFAAFLNWLCLPFLK